MKNERFGLTSEGSIPNVKEEKSFYETLSEIVNEEVSDKQDPPKQEPVLYDEDIFNIGRKASMLNRLNQETSDDLMDRRAEAMIELYSSDIEDLTSGEFELYV